MESVDLNGQRIAYVRSGSGPPVVLLHGVLADSRVWRPQIDALSDEFTVVAWDAPGCGGSSDPPDDIGLSGYADRLAGFMDALGLRTPHVVGLSFGGTLAIELAIRHPGSARSLVLASAYAGWAGSLPPDTVRQRLDQALRESDLPADRFVPGWIPGLLTESAPADVVDATLQMMFDFHPAGYRAIALAMASADLRAGLPTIRVPTLVLHAERDERAPRSAVEALHAGIRGSRLAVLGGVGHLSSAEAPDLFTSAIRGFLRTVA
jgi:pimeloyl-ACP methyl ester carboxylesterase